MEEDKETFWKSYLKDIPFTKFPNTTILQVESKKTNSLRKSCEASLQEIKERCQCIGVSIQSACQASWARILSSYTGEPSVRFGLVLSGRNNFEEAESAALPLVTIVPVGARVDGSNSDLLKQLMGNYPSLVKHQFTPLPKIQRWTSQSDEPLFDSIVAYQDSSSYATSGKSLLKILEDVASVDYPISVEFVPSDAPEDILEIRIIASDEIIPQEQAALLLDQLEATLLDSIRYPDNQSNGISSFPKKLLSITPAKEVCIPSSAVLLHHFPEKVALSSPDKIALEFVTSIDGEKIVKHQWTYRDLDKEANRVAQYLIYRGIGPKSMIAVCFNKCPEASFAILGILKAGCSFVAIDPAAPADRQRFIVQDSKSCLVLAMEDTAVALRENAKSPVVSLDDFAQSFWTYGLPESCPILSPKLQDNDICYCLYTSGTSGTPKACLLTHENAVQAMMSFQRLFRGRWDENSRFLQFASFHFDVSILEQYWSWSVGICVTSAPRDLIFEDMGAFIRALHITHLDLTPSLARTLHPDEVPSLCNGVFINGGEKLAQDILDLWGSKGCIYNGYGPTETTIGNTMFPKVPANGRPSNIGKQFDNVGTYVLRPGTDSPVLRGAVGELCVAGKLVGPGYLNQPELTNQKFSFLRDYDERVYRTGDLVRVLYDNSFDILGRADDQVKLRGQRLEVAEINEVIKRGIDQVRDVATLVLEHMKSQRMQLVSFFVLNPPKKRGIVLEILGGDVSRKIASTIRQICQDKLPPYMIPSHFIAVNSIPLSSNNKIETRQLKSLYNDLSSADLENLDRAQREPESAWTDVERRIAKLLSTATGSEISSITKDSSIFRIGLDSISVVNFARSLKDSGFSNAQVSTVMRNPTVSELSKALAKPPQNHDSQFLSHLLAQKKVEAFRRRHLLAVCSALSIPIGNIDTMVPCTPLQEGIISRSLGSDTSIYFDEFNFELSPVIDMQKLKHAWNRVTASTQILRTRFYPTTDGYAQAVCRDFQLPWYEKEFSNQKELDDFRSHQYNTWWTTNRELLGYLFEISILQSHDQKLMCFRIFHALYDGHSILKIFQNLQLEYNDASNVNYGPPYHEVLTYGPLCEADGAKEFWRSRFGDLNYEAFPNLPTLPSQGTSSVSVEIPRLPMNEARRKYSTTHQSLIQAAWATVLRKYFPSQIIFGTVTSGRSIDLDDVDQVIGPLFNTIPIHIDFKGCTSWSELIGRFHDFNTAVLPYQHSSLRDIMKWCRRSQESPLFETLFVFQKETTIGSMNAHQLWTQIESASKPDYPLSFEAQLLQDEETLRLTILAQDGTSTEENSTKMLNDLKIVLSEIVIGSGTFELNANISIQDATDASRKSTELNTSDKVEIETVAEQFSWSPEASIIRDEIALLADCETSTVGAQSSIISLGLDSIDVVKLSSRLKRHLIDISVSMIMRNPTIERMLSENRKNPQIIKESTNTIDLAIFREQLSGHLRSSGAFNEDIEDLLPPTPLQEAMVADMLSTKSLRYFNQEIFLLDRSTNVDKLMLAWKLVVKQSPILRTSFISIDDPKIPISFAQVVHRPGTSRIRSVEVGLQETHAIIEDAKKIDKANAVDGAPFMLTFVHGKDDTHLILSISHALYDGWSLALLHHDVLKAYQDDYSPRPSYRSALEHILNDTGSEASQYWSNYVSGATSCSFPSRVGSHQVPSQMQTQIHRLEQSSAVSGAGVRSFIKREGITLQALGQTCWALVLASYMKSFDVIFGVVLSGRNTEESGQLLFPTMNTITVRSGVHGSAKQMLRDMQDSCVDATQFQHFPLRKVQAAAKGNGKRLFDSLFILQRKPSSSQNSKQLYESVGGDSSVEFPVCVEMELESDCLNWRIACENSIFDRDGSKDLMERIDSVFREILESSEKPMVEIRGDSASVCGLPPFRINRIKDVNNTVSDTPDISDEEWTNTESLIRKILSDVSHIPEKEISKNETIFSLGLDSISAIKVSSLLRKRSLNLGVGEMLKAATVLKMAQVADKKALNGSSETLDSSITILKQQDALPIGEILLGAGINMGDVEKTLPCGPGQVYMLSRWQNSEGVLFYPTFCYQTFEHLDKPRLFKAWETLCETTPILRTTFASTEDRQIPFIQVILNQSPSSINWLANPPSNELPRPILSSSPVSLAVLEPPESSTMTCPKTTLFLTIHHALYDGVSLTILLQRFQDLYENPRTSVETKPSLEDFLTYDLTTSSQEARKEFWSTYLKNSHHELLPLTDCKLNTSMYQWNSQFRSGLISSIDKISSLARDSNISLQALFLATYAHVHATLLSRIALSNPQPSDVIFGIYLANRSLPLQGLPKMAAPTLNLVPLLVRAALTTPILQSAKIIQQDLHAIASPQNSRVGLWEIKDLTGVEIDCFVNFLSLPNALHEEVHTESPRWEDISPEWDQGLTARPKLSSEAGGTSPTTSKFLGLGSNPVRDAYRENIDIEVKVRNGSLDVGIVYPEAMQGSEHAAWMMEELKRVLEGL